MKSSDKKTLKAMTALIAFFVWTTSFSTSEDVIARVQVSGAIVEGTVLTMIKQVPIKGIQVKLVSHQHGRQVKRRTITDDDGHFRFIDVPVGSYSIGGPDRKSELDYDILEVAEGKSAEVVVKEGRGVYTFGKVFLADTAEIANFGRLCDMDKPGQFAELFGRKFIALIRGKGQWDYQTGLQQDISRSWNPQPECLVCVDEARQQVGVYSGVAPAYKITWGVRVIRLSDGKVWKNSFTEVPPTQTQILYSPTPLAQLMTWLKTGFVKQ